MIEDSKQHSVYIGSSAEHLAQQKLGPRFCA